jgi:HlyD family secretion protein
MKNRGRWIAWLVVGGVVAAIIVYGLKPRPAMVEAAAVSRGPLRVSIVEEGKTRVRDRYIISAPVAGQLRRTDLDVGDPVEAGKAILWLDPVPSPVLDPRSRAEIQARIAAAEAAVETAHEQIELAQAELRFRETDLARMRELVGSGAVAQELLDQAETEERKATANFRSARFQLEANRHALDEARAALRYSAAQDQDAPAETVAIRAPVSGRVLRVFQESEGVVTASEPLLAIGDPSGLEVEVEILSSDAVAIREGGRVLLERWGGEKPLEARVRRIEPVAFTKISALGVEEQRVLAILDIVSPAEVWQALGDGYRVEARFVVWEGEDVLQVPNTALFRVGNDWAVFRIENEQAVLRRVEIGHRSSLQSEVLDGLQPGEEIIAHPGEGIEEGDPVRPAA